MIDLRQERVNRGLSLHEAAELMDVDVNTLSRAERRESVPVPRNALKIARFFGHQVTDVWPLDEEPTAGAAA